MGNHTTKSSNDFRCYKCRQIISRVDIADEDPIICRKCYRSLPRCDVCGNAAEVQLYIDKEYNVCGKQCILILTKQHENDYKK